MFEYFKWQVTYYFSGWFISPFAAQLECPSIYIYNYVYNCMYIHMYTYVSGKM